MLRYCSHRISYLTKYLKVDKMSQLFVDNIKNRTGGAVGFPTGVVVTGIATFNNQVSIAGTLTYEDVTNVDSTGIITAKSGVKVTGGEILVGSDSLLVKQVLLLRLE